MGSEGFEPRFCAELVLVVVSASAKPMQSLWDCGGFEHQTERKRECHQMVTLSFLARPEGFEPPAFGIGIHCDIQLRHGRMWCFCKQISLYTTLP